MPSLPTRKRRLPWEPAPIKREYQAHSERTALYDSPLWRRVRRAHLAAHPLCVHCAARNELTPATVLDHVIPVRDGAEFFDSANHAGLCKSCHASKSAKEGHARRHIRNQNKIL